MTTPQTTAPLPVYLGARWITGDAKVRGGRRMIAGRGLQVVALALHAEQGVRQCGVHMDPHTARMAATGSLGLELASLAGRDPEGFCGSAGPASLWYATDAREGRNRAWNRRDAGGPFSRIARAAATQGFPIAAEHDGVYEGIAHIGDRTYVYLGQPDGRDPLRFRVHADARPTVALGTPVHRGDAVGVQMQPGGGVYGVAPFNAWLRNHSILRSDGLQWMQPAWMADAIPARPYEWLLDITDVHFPTAYHVSLDAFVVGPLEDTAVIAALPQALLFS